jgi:CRP/FNR family transcriptional regulator, cyclic AMP receptor protein
MPATTVSSSRDVGGDRLDLHALDISVLHPGHAQAVRLEMPPARLPKGTWQTRLNYRIIVQKDCWLPRHWACPGTLCLPGSCRIAATSTGPEESAMETDVRGILRRTDLLRSVSADDLDVVIAGSRLRAFRRGQVVFTRGDPGDSLIVVISGRVKVVIRSADGAELTLTIIEPGGVFGELGIVDGGPRSADAETLDMCQLLLIPRGVIHDVCARVPSVAQALLASIAATLRRLTEAASDLVFLDLPRRVAKVLLSQPRGSDGVIRVTLRQEELAHQAAGTRQSVNAALRGFERRGWIEVRERTVTVTHEAALDRFARN